MATVGSGKVCESVKLPPDVDRDEWIAAKVHSIYEEVIQIVNLLEDLCSEESCPCMNAGKHWTWKWADERNKKPQALSAPSYMRRLVAYADEKLQSEDWIPMEGDPFPDDFTSKMSLLVKRFFRVYAHAYLSHIEPIRAYGADGHLNCRFKHLLAFSQEFGLLTAEDMAPLKDLIGKFGEAHAASPKVTEPSQ